jgi:hypothetical protein
MVSFHKNSALLRLLVMHVALVSACGGSEENDLFEPGGGSGGTSGQGGKGAATSDGGPVGVPDAGGATDGGNVTAGRGGMGSGGVGGMATDGAGAATGGANTGGTDGATGGANTGGMAGTTSLDAGPCSYENVFYLLLDQSGSMLEGMPQKWSIAQTGISTFLRDSQSAGLDIAFQLFSQSSFPPSGCGLCDGSDCAIPLVPPGPLPDAATAIESALAVTPIGIGTPLEAALRGGPMFCAQFQQDNPGRRCSVILVTDGAPTSCTTDPAILGQILSTAFSNDSVQTFVVGMTGADFVLLDELARQGGTDCDPSGPAYACNGTDAPTFAAQLGYIRDAAAGACR